MWKQTQVYTGLVTFQVFKSSAIIFPALHVLSANCVIITDELNTTVR